MPVTAFRTGYRRNAPGDGPEVSITVRQLYLPGHLGAAMTGAEPAAPMLRSMSASFDDRSQISDNVTMQYGFTMDSVSFLNRLNYFSPYARLNYSLGEGGELAFAYTSGNARPDLDGQASSDSGLQRNLNTLGLFPRISVRGGRPRIQRGEEYELTYTRKLASRTYEASAYRESVTNAALTMVAPDGMYSGADLLPDLFGGNSIFNAGAYRSMGYTAAENRLASGPVRRKLDFQRRRLSEHGIYGGRYAECGRPPQRHAFVRFDGRAHGRQPRDSQPQSRRAARHDPSGPQAGPRRARRRHGAPHGNPRHRQLRVGRQPLGDAGAPL